MFDLSLFGWIHVSGIILSYITAFFVFFRPKAGPTHKKWGKIYAVSMLTAALSGFGMYGFTGSFNIFHVCSVITITSVSLGWFNIVKFSKTGNKGALAAHYFNMCYSFMGLNLAALAQGLRYGSYSSGQDYLATVLILYIPAIGLSVWLIQKRLLPRMIKDIIASPTVKVTE